MTVRPKPSIRVSWDGEPAHPSYTPAAQRKKTSDGDNKSVSTVAPAAVVVVKNRTPAGESEVKDPGSDRPSHQPLTPQRTPQPPPVRTERTQVGIAQAPTDSYIPPRPTDPPRVSSRPAPKPRSEPPSTPEVESEPALAPEAKSEPALAPEAKSEPALAPEAKSEPAQVSQRPRKSSDEFDFDNQVRAEGTLLSAQADDPENALDSESADALDDETELAQVVSEPPPPMDEGRRSPPPTPSMPARARPGTGEGKQLAPPPVPVDKSKKKRVSQEPPADKEGAAEERRDLAAIPVVSGDVLITDGAAIVEATVKKPTVRHKPGWYEKFFDENYLRTYRVPPPDAVVRQCDFIESQLDLAEGGRVLDVGCGLGLQAKELSRRGYEVVALDSSSTMISLAKESDHGVSFRQADMRDMAFENEFDGAILWGTTFGYFDDTQNKTLIELIRNAVRPNGMLIVDVVNRDYVMRSQPNLIWFEGEGCVCLEESDFNSITSRLHVKRTTVLSDGRQVESPYSMRLYSVHELGQVLHNKGFRAKRVSGHPATPGVFFGADSPRIIMAAERRTGSKADRATVAPDDTAKRRST